MSLTRVNAIVLRQLFLLKRSLGRLFGVLYWPTMELFLWGVLTVYLNKTGGATFNFVTVLLGALIFWEVLLRSQQGVSTTFLEDVWSRNLTNIFASPLTLLELLAGSVITSCIQTLISISVISALAGFLLHFNIFQFGMLLVPFVAILLMLGWAFGIVASAVILRYGPAAEVLAWSLPFLFQPLSAVFYPVSALPHVLQPIAKLLPSTYVFEGMRKIITNGTFDLVILLTALGLTVIYLAVSVLVFSAVFRTARRKGFLVRFSTEGY